MTTAIQNKNRLKNPLELGVTMYMFKSIIEVVGAVEGKGGFVGHKLLGLWYDGSLWNGEVRVHIVATTTPIQ